MKTIYLDKKTQADLTNKLAAYLSENHELDLGQFEAEMLFDFIADKMGCYFYNQGIYDAQKHLMQKMDALTDALFEIEKPVD